MHVLSKDRSEGVIDMETGGVLWGRQTPSVFLRRRDNSQDNKSFLANYLSPTFKNASSRVYSHLDN